MTEIFERLWSATHLRYPENSRIPRRDSLAAEQLSRDQTRRTITSLEEYSVRRRSSLGIARNSLMREIDRSERKRTKSLGATMSKIRSSLNSIREEDRPFDHTGVPTSVSEHVTPGSGIKEEDEDEEEEKEKEKEEEVCDGGDEAEADVEATKEKGSTGSDSPLTPPAYVRQRKKTMIHEQQIEPSKQYPIVIHGEFHRVMFDFCESRIFSGFILVVILLNTAMLLAQCFYIVQVRLIWYFGCLDNVFLGIYCFELTIKLYVWRIKYFNEGWNWLDFVIVVFNIVDYLLPLVIENVGDFSGADIFRLLRIFRAVRALRALRVLRTIRFLANLQVIMTTILQSIRSIGAIVMLILLFMYMFAVIGRGLYSKVDEAHFGNLLYAAFTLFQLLTLDDWFDIYNDIVNADPDKWHVILFLLFYIVVEYFIFLNLFVAVLVDNFHLTIEAQNEVNLKKKKEQEQSDDEDDSMSVTSDMTELTDFSDDMRVRRGIEEYYTDIPSETRDRLKSYFRIRSAMGYNMQVLADQERVLQMMVDLCAEAPQDDYGV